MLSELLPVEQNKINILPSQPLFRDGFYIKSRDRHTVRRGLSGRPS
ncbi:hypothetical protein CLOSYM_01795 [[Clostridium] symbiosum ATCC 14940]|uniref:Uncharacterized protein n=1 Tax=[Clostridium] symbiosum ATCC 14940 TaxID=411472 RepID=A0ABC9TZ24_CLOSY|nr:hypothetical protein CLOSYM_01795 [[Clostridium] symbiosum ATCC 14940]